MPFGNLFRNIHHQSASEKDVLQWYNRGRKVAVDVARGLVYLHGRKVGACLVQWIFLVFGPDYIPSLRPCAHWPANGLQKNWATHQQTALNIAFWGCVGGSVFVSTGLDTGFACYGGQVLLMRSRPLICAASAADLALRHKVWQHPPRSRRGCQDCRCAAHLLV